MIYRPSIGPDSLRDALRATFVGDWKEPSEESRLEWFGIGGVPRGARVPRLQGLGNGVYA